MKKILLSVGLAELSTKNSARELGSKNTPKNECMVAAAQFLRNLIEPARIRLTDDQWHFVKIRLDMIAAESKKGVLNYRDLGELVGVVSDFAYLNTTCGTGVREC